ncbi:MAG: Gfo/Idh/MocA family oxidoreductase [Planctomycetes bacterium]|nr:Gfo/Idh/MocA family oxidoreductase [Planctomycetota bacterium]
MSLNRRQFLRTAAAAATPLVLPASVLARDRRPAPADRITLGVVGLGSRGFNLIDAFLNEPDAQIVAVCDVDSLHYRDNPWGQGRPLGRDPAKQRIEARYAKLAPGAALRGLDAVADYRELCGREDLDAVVVATPDHWHALCALDSLRAGKDVYCEKPVAHRFHEGQRMCREVARRGAVVQVGSQQRSDPRFRHAVELVLNGHIGKVRRVEVGLPPGYDGPQGDTTIVKPPEHLDYDFWCGPAPKLPYMQARHHRWWRGHLAYGGGVLMDWIGHHNDVAHWALGMDRSGPLRVEAVEWTFPETDVYNTPHHYEIRSEYPGGVTGIISDRNRGGTKWIGDDGWVFVTRGRLEASDPRWAESGFDPGSVKAYKSPGHARNFLDCVKSRQPCVAPVETAHRSITPGHLGYVSHSVGRPLHWNAAEEQITGDDEAEKLLKDLSYRKPWELDA